MNQVIDKLTSAKLILVPKGDDNQPCLKAFEAATGLKVPTFKERQLEARAKGRTYIKVKGRDIPKLIAAGYGDLGLTGSDSCEEYLASDATITYETFGPKMCRFVLLTPAKELATVRQKLQQASRSLPVITSFPEVLKKYAGQRNLRVVAADMMISGSVEIMPRLLGISLVADLVASGSTAKANGLVEVETFLDVYPAVVVRRDCI